MSDVVTLAQRVATVHARIADAAARVGRPADKVTLIAVSKTIDAGRIAKATREGLSHFGENRVQEAAEKIPEVDALLQSAGMAPPEWDLIGHLQSNKARPAVKLFRTIQSVDSLSLARQLDRLGRERGTPVRVLLEVNIGEEPSKFGFRADELLTSFPDIRELTALDVRGLMTVAPVVDEAEQARPFFRQLRQLRDRLQDRYPEAQLPELSMGMTGDYPVAIEEGATIVRIGRAIFGERPGQ